MIYNEKRVNVPEYVWSAICPNSNKIVHGIKQPTIEQQNYQNFTTDLPHDRTSVTYLTKDGTYTYGTSDILVIWNNNDDSYWAFRFKTESEALQFQDMLNSAKCWWEIKELLHESKEVFDYIEGY